MIKINHKYKSLFSSNNDLIIITGGRGSGKSFVVADWACRLTYVPNQRILYTRYTLTSAGVSIIPEYKDKIDLFNAEADFDITQSFIRNNKTGSDIIFKGIKSSSGNQTANLKSIKDPTKWICDEAIEIPDYNTFQRVRRSLRKKDTKIQTILILNPESPSHWIYERFFEKKNIPDYFNGDKDGITYIHTNYLDNYENLDEAFLNDAEKTKQGDFLEYENIFLGRWVDYTAKVLFPKTELNYFKLPDINLNEYDSKESYTDWADGGDYFATIFTLNMNGNVYILDVIFNNAKLEYNEKLLKEKIIAHGTLINCIESNGVGRYFGMRIGKELPDIYRIQLFQTTSNKEVKIKTFAEVINSRFFFRSDIDYESEYAMFLRNLCSYVYLGKNKHDDAPDNCASYCKLLIGSGYIK